MTYNWKISNPINNYNVALNIAPYKVITDQYRSVTGEMIPVFFWVLPEDYDKGVKRLPEFLDHLRFHEELLGPYPFRNEKYGIAETPHLGMEHQTIIAYGAKFDNGAMTNGIDWGFDALHHHELSHEWWGNLVTNADWKDMWIHEGFGTYMQALYLERTQGRAAYQRFIAGLQVFWNAYPVAPRASTRASEIVKAPIYTKGATILHTLRYFIGSDNLFKALRRMAYYDPAMEKITDGRQTRFVTTDDFRRICEQISGKNLQWFFDVYLHQPLLPILINKREGGRLVLKWETPDELPFPMPVDVKIGDQIRRIEIPSEGVTVEVGDLNFEIDPDHWVLHGQPYPTAIELTPKELLPYVGKYKSARGSLAIVFLRKDYLMLQTRFQPDVRLYPESNRGFSLERAATHRSSFRSGLSALRD